MDIHGQRLRLAVREGGLIVSSDSADHLQRPIGFAPNQHGIVQGREAIDEYVSQHARGATVFEKLEIRATAPA